LKAAILRNRLTRSQIAYGAGYTSVARFSELFNGDFPMTEATLARVRAVADIVDYGKPLTIDATNCPHCGERLY